MHLKQLIPATLWLAVVIGCGSEPSAAEYLERAFASEREGELRTASIEVRNALKGEGENRDARLLLGTLQLRLGDSVGAEKELTKARELGAEDADTLPSLALALRRQGKFDELKALDAEGLPADGEAAVLASRAYAHLADGDQDAARAEAERALELAPDATDAALVLVRLQAMEGDLAGAADSLRETLESDAGNAEGWELLGDVERAAGRADDAVTAYDEALSLSAQTLSARLKRAELQLERGEDEAALADLDALTEAGVELPAIAHSRGRIDLKRGDLAEAQLRFENALKNAPEYPPALAGLAVAHLALGNVNQAEQYGKQMLTATNESDAARRLLGAIRFENGRHELAAETIEPIIRDGDGRDVFAMRLMNTVLLKQDRYEEAIERMTTLANLLPRGAADGVDSPLVLARAPSRELLDEFSGRGGATPIEREPGDELLDEDDRRIARVLELLRRGEHETALDEAEALLEDMPDSAVPHNLIARVHAAAGREEETRTAFERALEIDENDATARRYLAELALRANEVDAARTHLEQALRGDGDSENVLLALARLESRAGDEPAMLDWIERARGEHPDSAAPTLLLAGYRASRAEHEQALEALERLDERQRTRSAALRLEGASLLALRRFDEAVERFDALVEREPRVAQWHYLRAQAHAGRGDNEETVQGLEQALELSLDHVPSLLALTNVDILRGDFEAAETRIDALRDLIPGQPELDAIVTRLAERREAIADGDVPGQLRIENTEAALAAARDLYGRGEPEQAANLLETWLEANPGDIAVRLTLANTYAAGERVDEAIEQYETLLGGDEVALPAEARLAALNNLAWYLRERDPESAVDYAERALEVTPDSVPTLDTLAMIRFGQGEHAAAKDAFDRAMALGIEDPTIRFHGARIEAALGNDAAARALLEPLVDDGVEFPEAADAAGLLGEIGRSDR